MVECRVCHKTGEELDEFTSPYTGLCRECTQMQAVSEELNQVIDKEMEGLYRLGLLHEKEIRLAMRRVASATVKACMLVVDKMTEQHRG